MSWTQHFFVNQEWTQGYFWRGSIWSNFSTYSTYLDRQALANSVDPDCMVKLHWNSDVFNQKFVISPRTGRNLLLLHRKKYYFCSMFTLRTTILDWLYRRLNKWGLNCIARFWISTIQPKCQPYFNWHQPWTPPKVTLHNHLWKILFFSQHGVVRVEISSHALCFFNIFFGKCLAKYSFEWKHAYIVWYLCCLRIKVFVFYWAYIFIYMIHNNKINQNKLFTQVDISFIQKSDVVFV